jgi:hypothetical protein
MGEEFTPGQVVYFFDGRVSKFEKVVIKEKHASNSYICKFKDGTALALSESLYPTLNEILFEIDMEYRGLGILKDYLLSAER